MSVLFVHNDLNKNNLKLQHPKGIKGGAYTSVISHNEGAFYLQLPKCMLRNGIVKTEKKVYCDLLFDKYDEQVVSWFENLQITIQDLIYEKKNVWFNGEIEKDDIEDTFISMIKTYRSGKKYLVRCYLPKEISNVSCYNDKEESVSLDNIVGEETLLIPLVEIANLRFTSRNFQVDLVLRELMIIEDDDSDDSDDSDNDSDDSNDGDNGDDDDDGDDSDDGDDDGNNYDNNSNKETNEENKETNEENKETNEDNKETNEENKETNEETNEENKEQKIKLEIEDISNTNTVLAKNNIKENTITEESVKEESVKEESNKETNNNLQEVSLDLDTLDNSKPIILKAPQNVYYAIWQNAKQRLKFHRAEALKAFLEAKNIKNTYLVDQIDNDSDDEFKLEQ